MTSALGLLVWMQLVGWMRFVAGNLKTVRGALLMGVALLVFVPWLLTVFFVSGAGAVPRAEFGRFGPAILLLYVLSNFLFSPSDRAISFSPAEVQFLFAGPFSRRQILAYKVVLTLLATLPLTLFMGLIIRVKSGWPPAVFLGLLFMLVFLNLFTLAMGLLGDVLGAALHTRLRRALAVVVVLGVGVGVYLLGEAHEWDLPRAGLKLLDSDVWKRLSWPLASFFQAMTARTWADLAVPALVGLGLNLLILLGLFVLDAQFLEQAAASSSHRYARIMRARGQTVNVEPIAGKERRAAYSLPAFPFMGGVGPIFWRQLITASRSYGRLIFIVVLLSGAILLPLLAKREEEIFVLMSLFAGIVVWLSIFLTVLVPFDFRGDIDRMAMLKTLPIPSWRIALGQILTPTLILTLIHWFLLALIVSLRPVMLLFAIGAALTVPVFNFYVMAVDNLLFLFFPTRIQAATPGDFQAMGRNILLSFGKLLGLIVPIVSGAAGGIVFALTHNPWIGLALGWIMTATAGVVLIPLAGWAFDIYDVGRNAPS